jgi:uncharacterized protein (TIGR03118 family)
MLRKTDTTQTTPTGIIKNTTKGFKITNFTTNVTKKSDLIMATEDGIIYGYNCDVNNTNAIIMYSSTTGAVYKGLAIVGKYLYVADFFNNRIDVFDENMVLYNQLSSSSPDISTGNYAPFNVVNLNNYLYVVYAFQQQNKHDDLQL